MKLAIDLDTGAVTDWNGGLGGATARRVKRADRLRVEAVFRVDGINIELPETAQGMLALKRSLGIRPGPAGIVAAAGYVAVASDWTVSGFGSGRVYVFDLNLNTVELNALFAEEPESVALIAEVSVEQDHSVITSATFNVIVANDIIRPNTILPVAEVDLKATQAQSQNGTNNTTWMTPLRTKQAFDSMKFATSRARLGSDGSLELSADGVAWVRLVPVVEGGVYTIETRPL